MSEILSKSNISIEGSITANSLITFGGTSSHFVKGDGSLDSNTYATISNISIPDNQVAVGTGNGIEGDSNFTWDGSTLTVVGKLDLDYDFNVYIGTSAGANDDETDNENVGIGYAALASNTSGYWNVGIGRSSLYSNTEGFRNTAIGYRTLQLNTTGDFNTAVGEGAMQNNTTASFNTAIGRAALYNNTTGERNTAIGYSALLANTTGYANIGIGFGAGKNIQNGYENIAIGEDSLRDNVSGVRNTAIGQDAMRDLTTGSFNFALGRLSMYRNNGDYNIAIGSSMLAAGVGSRNIAMGTALYDVTDGDDNIALGYLTMKDLTTGDSNIAIGRQSFEFLGTSSSQNIAIGIYAGRLVSTGANFTGAGNNSIFLGYYTRPKEQSSSNEIVIGQGAIGNGSNTVTIGNSSISDNYFSKTVHADAFKTNGGASSQFVKGDGTLDSNTYLTSFDITTQTDPKYLRSDVADVKTSGDLTMNTSIKLHFGTSGSEGSEIFYNGTANYLKLVTGDLIVQDNANTRFTFERTTGNLDITGDFQLASTKKIKFSTISDITNNAGDTALDMSSGDFVIRDNGTTRFTFKRTTGNFGIGVTGPTVKLDVRDSINTAYSTTNTSELISVNDMMSVYNTGSGIANGYSSIFFENTGNSGRATGRFGLLNQAGGNGGFFWHLRDSSHTGETREKMRLTSDGDLTVNVGNIIADTEDKYFIANSTSFPFGGSNTIGVQMGANSNGIDGSSQGEILFKRWTGSANIHHNALISQVRQNGTGDWGLGFYNSSNTTTVAEPRASDITLYLAIDNQVGINNDNPTESLDVTGNGVFSGNLTVNGGNIFTSTTQGRVKLSVWSNTSYGIGMKNNMTFGGLSNDYALTSQMSNTDTRGFWWGDSNHTDAQGAMALTTHGRLTVASYTKIGYGQADATTPGTTYMLQVNGDIQASDFVLSSDYRLKENVKEYITKPININWKLFNYIGEDKTRLGVIAQEVEKENPEFVTTGDDGYKSVHYTQLLIAKNAELESRIERLEKLIEKLA